MNINRDSVLVVDIEATCWYKMQTPPDQRSEIIEIGICRYHLTDGRITQRQGILITPTESELSAFCIELTGITPAMLAQGISFEQACQHLQTAYQSAHHLWVSWGNYDRRMFIEQCQRRNLSYPFADQHCNLKNLFANIYGNRLGIKQAMDKLRLTWQGRQHRGVDDAHNIARTLHHLLQIHGTDLLDSFWE
ncbi:MAG: exonuclease domain-containing protein [Anaerolineae bacterium]